MNSSLMMMLAQRGSLDANTLRSIVTRGNDKRRRLFTKLADLLFGLFMLIFGQLKLKDSDGKDIDLTKPLNMSPDDKMNALLVAADSTQRSVLYRELLRPAIVNIAELIATMMEPDEMMLQLMGASADGSTTDPSGTGIPTTNQGVSVGQAEIASGRAMSAAGVGDGAIFCFGTAADHDQAIYVRRGNRANWGRSASHLQDVTKRTDWEHAIIYVPWTNQQNILFGPTD